MCNLETTFASEYVLANDMMMLYREMSKENEYCSVSCVAHYEYIKDLATALICEGDGDISISNIELSEPELKGYSDEFVLSLDSCGIWIEEEKKDGIYYDLEDNIIFIHNDCNSLIFKKCSECSSIVTFDFEDEQLDCDGNCDCCECKPILEEDEYDDLDSDGFSLSFTNKDGTTSYSFYSLNKELVEKTRNEMIKKIDI